MRCAVLVLLVLSGTARAQSADAGIDAAIAEPAPPADAAPAAFVEPTARDTEAAPVPGEESGRLDKVDDGDGVGRLAARTVLWLPRLAIDLVWFPVHGVFVLTDRYHIEKLYYRVFYNANQTVGLVPVAVFRSGLGLDIGARFVASDIFGEHERFSLQATTGRAVGQRHREGANLSFGSGDRFSKHFALGLTGSFDRRPADPFYGIGNGDDRTDEVPAMPVDPSVDDFSREVKYRYQEARAAIVADIKPTQEIRFRLTGALTDLEFEPSSDGIPIGTVYNEADIPGFGGVQHAYGELEVRWDTRDRSTPWESAQIPTQGSLVEGYIGRIDRLDGGKDFWRYGGELQHFFRLARGPRVLIARLHAAGVTGSREDVPFTELAMLGGGDFLRGYSYNRFRDRAAAFGSLQYEWDLSHFTAAYLFTDVGRVWESFEDITAKGLRVGYGIGIDVHGESAFLFTASVASSIDGGLFLNFAFNQPINGVQTWR